MREFSHSDIMSGIILLSICVIFAIFPDITSKRTRVTYEYKNKDILRIYAASKSVNPDVKNYAPIYEVMSPAPWGEVNISGIFWNKTISNEPVIDASQLTVAPRFTWESDPSKFYTFFLTHVTVNFDLWGYFHYHHWIVGNIHGCDISSGEEIVKYLPPIGQHGLWRPMYRAVAYEQPDRIDFSHLITSNLSRTFITVDDFVANYSMADNMKASRTFFVDADNGATTPLKK